jgi:transposase
LRSEFLFSPVENKNKAWQPLLPNTLHACGEIERRIMLPILSTSHTIPVTLFNLDSSSEPLQEIQEIVEEQSEEGGHADFLNIPGLRSDPLIIERKCVIRVQAKQIKKPTYPDCDCRVKMVKPNGSFAMDGVLDLPRAGKTVIVNIRRRRWMCISKSSGKTCGKTIAQPLDIMTEDHYRITRRLLEYCEVKALLGTELSLAEETGISPRTIRSIRQKHVERLKNEIQFATPHVLGLDGVRGENNKRRIILTNIQTGEVIDLLKKGNKESIAERIEQFPNFKSIKIVTIDMCRTLLGVVLMALPNAIIIIDAFHILRTANQSMDKVRNRLYPRVKKERESGKLHRPRPEPFRKRRANLTKRDKKYMEFWFNEQPALKLAYDLKEAYLEIFARESDGNERLMSRAEAECRYQKWKSSFPVEEEFLDLQKDFKPILSAMNNWGKYVFNRFDHDFTNAYTEAMNRRIKDILRESRGCSFDTLHAKIVFGTRLRKEIKADRVLEMSAARPHSGRRQANMKSQRAVQIKSTKSKASKAYVLPNLDQIAFGFLN